MPKQHSNLDRQDGYRLPLGWVPIKFLAVWATRAYDRFVMGCHTTRKGVQKGGPSHFCALTRMPPVPYTKPHATTAQRVAHLAAKGLIIQQPAMAADKIDMIGYHRLRIYFLSRRQMAAVGRPFEPGTTDQDIFDLYGCDALLRSACFDAVGQFEMLLRNAISEELSSRFGSHPYDDQAAFHDAQSRLVALQCFIQTYTKSKDQRAKHYKTTYRSPALPPIWTMKEFLTFGSASRIYQSLEGTIRTAVAAQFGVPKDEVFENWVECLVDLRNHCAHHDRLFNRNFQKQPQLLRRAGVPQAHPTKLKAILECLDYLLTSRGAPADITMKVGTIIAACRAMNAHEAGF